ncbi:uncharacterized protein METZ01_LOCUS272737, partial [marine metagenome]
VVRNIIAIMEHQLVYHGVMVIPVIQKSVRTDIYLSLKRKIG